MEIDLFFSIDSSINVVNFIGWRTYGQIQYAVLYVLISKNEIWKTKSKLVKKTNSSIYHLENYIQIRKLNCILKILFNYDTLPPPSPPSRTKKIKMFHTIKTKWDIKNCFQARILTLSSYIEKVRESMFKIPVQCSN